MELSEHVAAVRAGVGDPWAMLGEFRRTAVLVPLSGDGYRTAEYGGVRWIHTFTDEAQLALFAEQQGTAGGEEWAYECVLGARLLDVFIPDLAELAGVAVNAADVDSAMLLPPVRGIVPERAAVDGNSNADGRGTPAAPQEVGL